VATHAAAPPRQRMSLSELVVRAIPLIPGRASGVESLLDAPSGAQLTDRGWQYATIEYRTSGGILVHVMLASDWNNRSGPDVVSFGATVDAAQCVDAAKFRNHLTATEKVEWIAFGTKGWVANIQGRHVSLSQRTGRCLASVDIRTRLVPLPMPPTHPMRIGPSGRPERVQLPVH